MTMLRLIALPALLGLAACATAPETDNVVRVPPSEVRTQLQSGGPLILACGYPAKECEGTHADGCITLEDLQGRLAALPKSHPIVFCCG